MQLMTACTKLHPPAPSRDTLPAAHLRHGGMCCMPTSGALYCKGGVEPDGMSAWAGWQAAPCKEGLPAVHLVVGHMAPPASCVAGAHKRKQSLAPLHLPGAGSHLRRAVCAKQRFSPAAGEAAGRVGAGVGGGGWLASGGRSADRINSFPIIARCHLGRAQAAAPAYPPTARLKLAALLLAPLRRACARVTSHAAAAAAVRAGERRHAGRQLAGQAAGRPRLATLHMRTSVES